MISVRNLTKRYREVVAVDDIDFDVAAGEVVGFLGPNGAGKSTTLRILAGYLPATEGTAQIGGLDVSRDSLEVRRSLGYLPENVPLYPEMRVEEYLAFRARLKGVARRDVAGRVAEKTALCGLADMRRRIVGHLSKGYRQRVGLADALLADPPVLILDEPTAGLDPAQRKEVRDLIAELGDRHTILLSSHILGEVDTISDRVMIIARGKIRGNGTKAELQQQLGLGGRLRVEARLDRSALEEILSEADGFNGSAKVAAEQSDALEDGFFAHVLEVRGEGDPREDLVRAIVARGVALREIRWADVSLEESFLKLTAQSAMEEIPA